MIYILLLEHGKFYVGFTERQNGERFPEHFSGQGAKWTKKYPPVEVLEWREGTKEDEDKITLKKYGWYNVRGGQWCEVNMSRPPNVLIEGLVPPSIEELKSSSTPICTRCNRNSHTVERCYARTKLDGTILNKQPKPEPQSWYTRIINFFYE